MSGGDLHFVGWGGCEISFCVCRRGVDRVYLGGVVKVSFMSLNNYISRLHFGVCYIGETILTWTTSKVLWYGIYSFLYILD